MKTDNGDAADDAGNVIEIRGRGRFPVSFGFLQAGKQIL